VLFALQTYEEALRTASSVELWEEYLEFCLDCLNSSAAKKDQTAVRLTRLRKPAPLPRGSTVTDCAAAFVCPGAEA
jgi:hypothetical protein